MRLQAQSSLLFLLAPFATSLSLSSIEPLSVSAQKGLTPGCISAYNAKPSGCPSSSLLTACTTACEAGLKSLGQSIIVLCRQGTIPKGSLLAAVMDGDIVSAVCNGWDGSAAATDTVVNTIPVSTRPNRPATQTLTSATIVDPTTTEVVGSVQTTALATDGQGTQTVTGQSKSTGKSNSGDGSLFGSSENGGLRLSGGWTVAGAAIVAVVAGVAL